MSATVIRLAKAADRPVVEAIVEAAYTPYLAVMDRPPAPMHADYAALIDHACVHVLVTARGVEGMVVLKDAGDVFGLETMAVCPGAQGRGLGRRLVAFAEDEARRRGHRVLRLYTNVAMTRNLEFYPRLGYVETRRVREAGFARVYFEKALD